jgi:hypothetical protein
MASIDDVKARIDFSSLSSVTVTNDGMQRGSSMQPSPSGIYIYRDGSITIAGISSDLQIVKQGGDGTWEGAKKDDHFGLGFTKQQEYVVAALMAFIFKNIDPEKVTVNE